MLPDNIFFSHSDFQPLIDKIKFLNPSKIFIISDTNSDRYCFPLLEQFFDNFNAIKIVLTPGEEHKNLNTCIQIWDAMTIHELDRKGLVINLGGGVIGDMGGFCASTYKRGIKFIQIPTTLLAMVDASVGGKLGIDFKGYKNHIGVFNNPEFISIQSIFLETLPYNELRSGFAEMIKHALIADAIKWNQFKRKKLEEIQWNNEITHSVEIKWEIVQKDPTENGLRKTLNFGHTLGHAFETYFLNFPERKLLHGEAIALGMVLESWISYKKNFLSENEFNEIRQYITNIFGKPRFHKDEISLIISLTVQDKKNNRNNIMFSLLKEIGNCIYDVPVTFEEMEEALLYYLEN
jgi:3-dehydroquinate synthase